MVLNLIEFAFPEVIQIKAYNCHIINSAHVLQNIHMLLISIISASMKTYCLSSPRQALINGFCNILINLADLYYFTQFLVFVIVTARNFHILLIIPVLIWIWFIVCVVLSVVMILGVLKKRYKLLAPYLCVGAFGMFLSGSVLLIIFTVLFRANNPSMKGSLSFAVLNDFIAALQLILWLPVYCLYATWQAEASGSGGTIKMNDRIQPLVAV